jgi:hypothetical protein
VESSENNNFNDTERDAVITQLMAEHPIEELVSFNETNIQEKIQNNAYLVVKYTELYLKEKNIYDKISVLRDKIVGERYDHYRYNFDKELDARIIERYYLPKDEKIIRVNKILQKQGWRVEFFQTAVDALKKLQWNMKIFLDSMKNL